MTSPHVDTRAGLDGLLELTRLVHRPGPLDELCAAMAAVVARSLGYGAVVVNLHRRATDDLEVRAVHAAPEVREALLGTTSTWADWAGLLRPEHRHGGAYFVRAGTYDWSMGPASHIPERPPASDPGAWDALDALLVPLLDGRGDTVGILSVDEPRSGRRPTADECALLAGYAAHLAHAVEVRRDGDAQRRQARALRRLSDLAVLALGHQDPAASLGPICAAVRETLGFAEVEAALVRGGRLEVVASEGPGARLAATVPYELDALLASHPAVHGVHEIPADGAPAAWGPQQRRGAGPWGWTAHALLTPLRERRGVLAGVLCAAAPASLERPSEEERRLLHGFAAQAEAALTSSAAAALRESEARKAAVLETALDAVLTFDARGRLLELNPAAERIFHIRREDVLGRDVVDLIVPPEQRGERRLAFEAEFAGGGRGRLIGRRVEALVQRADGERFPAEISVARIGTDGRTMFTAYLRDISDRVAAKAALESERDRAEHAALHDPLTGLPNRAAVTARLAARLRTGDGLVVLRIGLDDRGLVSDSLGHVAGQDVLRQVAERLRGQPGLVGHLGGDEFVLVGEGEAAACTAAVHECLARPFAVGGIEPVLRARLGAAAAEPGLDAGELLRRADIALQRARATLADTVVFSDELDDAGRRLRLATGLRRAVQDGELELHFQPLCRLADRRLQGYEALVRWRLPDGQLIPPAEFIPFAETSGLIEQIGTWVIDATCAQLARWRGCGADWAMGVNVSPRQLLRTDVPRLVADALERHGIPPAALCVELTESALRADVDAVRRTLDRLDRLGVPCAIDDFGADYSSLSRLRDLPVEMVKVDRAFLSGLPGDRRGEQLLDAIVRLADALGMRTVVEGIETAEQREFAAAVGAEIGQGFLLGRPEPARGITQRLAGAPALR